MFGGIVIGNDVHGPGKVQHAVFELLEDGSTRVPVLRVRVGGRTYDYSDWTESELWSAYHFVKPRLAFREWVVKS